MLDTHDGVGLPGAEGVLPADEIAFLVETARRHGAFVSCRSSNGGEVPYEILWLTPSEELERRIGSGEAAGVS
jgi:hypothetical protein